MPDKKKKKPKDKPVSLHPMKVDEAIKALFGLKKEDLQDEKAKKKGKKK